jgi:hypothetical protein
MKICLTFLSLSTFLGLAQSPGIVNFYRDDSLTVKMGFNNKNEWCIYVEDKLFRDSINLDEYNIKYRHWPEILWKNRNYVCVLINWTGPFSEHIFMPRRDSLSFHYFTEDVEMMDTANNNVVFISKIGDSTVTLAVANLLTNKLESVTFRINEINGIYPFYKNIYLSRNSATVETVLETKTISLNNLYR